MHWQMLFTFKKAFCKRFMCLKIQVELIEAVHFKAFENRQRKGETLSMRNGINYFLLVDAYHDWNLFTDVISKS